MKFLIFICLLTIVSAITSGCAFLFKKAYGIKNPSNQEVVDQLAYLSKKKIYGTYLYAFKNKPSLQKFYLEKTGLPKVLIFNKDSLLIDYSKDFSCNGKVDSFLYNLNIQKSEKYLNKEVKMSNYLKECEFLIEGKSVNEKNSRNTDFHLIIFWAIYAGKLNNFIPDWINQAKNNNEYSFKVHLINCDFQSSWTKNSSSN